jgi:type III restriction enzyme
MYKNLVLMTKIVLKYFLGDKPVTKTNDSMVDLGMIVRDIDELIVINDEAHHIHEENAWLKSIRDIDNKLKQKGTGLGFTIRCYGYTKEQ